MGDWFKDWFASDFYLSVYSHRNDKDAETFLNNLFSYISIPPGSKVLDAACGAGRHSIILAGLNYKVTAFDLSRPLLDSAIDKANRNNLNINFMQSDLRDFKSNEKFTLILNLFTSFGYFQTDEENFAFIRSAYGLLEKGGYFVFDYLNEEFIRKNLVAKSEKKLEDALVSEERSIRGNRVVKKIKIERNDKIKNFEESVQLYSFNDIIEHFNGIGFKAEKIFGSYGCTEFSAGDSERLIIIFSK